MVRPSICLIACALAVSACAAKYKEPIALYPHGSAVRANLAAQIMDPIPPEPAAIESDAARAALAVTAYRAGDVKDPIEASEKSTTTNVE